MKITTHQSQIRTIKKDDPRFHIQDKFMIAPRAGFEISSDCPQYYVKMIEQAVCNGWLKPVAHMTEREFIFAGLSNE